MGNRTILLGASLFVLYTIVLYPMQAVATSANTIRDVDFNSPFDNTYDLGNPFLVEYDNTMSLQPPRSANYDFEAVFSGYGIINGTRYTDTGISSYDIRGNGSSVVYQNGTIAMTTEAGEKAMMIFESLGQRNTTSGIVLDHGVIFLITNSTTGELASLNNTVYVYKDKVDERRGNLTTIAWQWNGGGNATKMAIGNVTNTPNASATTNASSGDNATDSSVSIVPDASNLTTNAFSPNPIQVSVGTTVIWANNDAEVHTVNAGENAAPTGLFDFYIPPGGTSEYTFTESGEYPYFCILHPNMVGTVLVSSEG